MSNFILPPPCRASLLIFLIAGGALSTFAEPRTFTNSQGRKIVAEPVSLGGDGTLDLKREDGNLFQIKISDLSLDDQQFLREWTVANPPKIDYRFEIKVADEKMAGTRSTELGGYKKVKNELWTYRVEIKNLSRQTVGGLKVDYRVFVRNEANGSFRSSDGVGEGFISGTAPLEKDLRYNESVNFTAGEMKLDSVSYDWSSMRDERYKDALRGIMIRIKDKNGKVVQEFISPNASMKGKTWDTVPASLEIKASE